MPQGKERVTRNGTDTSRACLHQEITVLFYFCNKNRFLGKERTFPGGMFERKRAGEQGKQTYKCEVVCM
jgi:hypothetical protein